MEQKKEFIIIHIYDGVVQTVGTNLPNVVVIIADEDRDNDIPASISSYSKEELHMIDNPEEMFEPEEGDNEFDKENKGEFLEQLKDIVYPEIEETMPTAFGFDIYDVITCAKDNNIFLGQEDAKGIIGYMLQNGDAGVGVNWDMISQFTEDYLKENNRPILKFHNEELVTDLLTIQKMFVDDPKTLLQCNTATIGKKKTKEYYVEVNEDTYIYHDEDQQREDFYMLQRFLATPEKLELVNKVVELTNKLFTVADASDQDRTFIDELCDKYGLLNTEAYEDSQRVALGSEEFYNAIDYNQLFLFYKELYARVEEIEKKAVGKV